MKVKNRIYSSLFSALILGATLLTPAVAEVTYTVRFVDGQMVVESSPQDGYIETFSVPLEQVHQQRHQVADNNSASPYAQEVLRLTNESRAKYGLAPLSLHPALEMAALSHSQEMLDLDYFSHTSPSAGRSDPSARVAAAGANPKFLAENIFQASGYDMADAAKLAVDTWLESPGHRKNIMSPSATHIGIGLAEKNGSFTATQVFGGGL